MENNYKNKYLKYKTKYLELKSQIGGVLEEEKQNELRTDICASYVTELIGTMHTVIGVIKKNKLYFENSAQTNSIAREIVLKWANISTIRVFNMDANNDRHKGKLYKDLFYFNHMDPTTGDYIIKSETRKLQFKKSTILTHQNLQAFSNTLISLEANEGVHWIYVDNNLKIHNPYNYNMQIDHSHQFCQSHSLLMALLPSMRQTCSDLVDPSIIQPSIIQEENERRCAYIKLLDLFSIILYPIILFVLYNDIALHNDILTQIKSINLLPKKTKKNIENNKFVNDFIKNLDVDSTQNAESNAIRISTGILGVLKTTYALEKAPEFQ